MEREEVQKFLMGQLAVLTKAGVADLMEERRHEEVANVLKNLPLDFSPIEKFGEEGDAVYPQGEIPEEIPLYELIAYMQQSGLNDEFFVEDDEDLQYMLQETEDEVLKEIGSLNQDYNICDCSMKQLLEEA